MNINTQTQGFIALTSVLILGAIVLSISIGIASRALIRTNTSADQTHAYTTAFAADACSERALIELIRTLDYAGEEQLNVGPAECEVLAVTGSGVNDRVIQARGTIYEYMQRVVVDIEQVSPDFIISLWKIVKNF